ncbi:MAG: tetratricopeptide repeat protein [Leptolyngbya sp. SIO4C1]|nr:tetratricopeptide repeat protein [Leptolyngbya sp. SIO4C1]
MIQKNLRISRTQRRGLSALLLGVAGAFGIAAPMQAQSLIEEQGALAPMRDEYAFEGEAGQAVTIQLSSAEFDTVLYLVGPDGTELEMNDDYGGTLNSTIVTTLPAAGEYKAVASSFSGQGGSYDILVRPASEYELVYDRAVELMTSEEFGEAIEAYTAAIALDPSLPDAYLGRADAYWGQVYLTEGENFKGPESLTPEAREAILADYDQAADLFASQGEAEFAASIREQAQILRTGEAPETDEPAVEEDMLPESSPESQPDS